MAPKAEKKPAKKVAKTAKTGGKKKSKAKVESFKIYIYKVLKQVNQPSLACDLPRLGLAHICTWDVQLALVLPVQQVSSDASKLDCPAPSHWHGRLLSMPCRAAPCRNA